MADRTTNDNNMVVEFDKGKYSFPIADGVTLGVGALVQLASGFLDHWDEAGIFIGIVVSGEDTGKLTSESAGTLKGNTSLTPDPRAYVDTSGAILTRQTSVAGTPTQAKVGDQIWSADSDADSITLSTTGNESIGRLWDFRSSTDVDIKLFPASRAASLAGIASLTDNSTGTGTDTIAAGVGISTMHFPFEFITSTSAINVADAFVPGFKFKILDWAWVDGGTALVGSSGSRVANMEIGSTDVGSTPSTCTVIQSGTAAGRRIDGTAVSGANTGSNSDSFSIEIASGGTDITAGNGGFHVVIQNMDTADASKSLSDKINEILATQ